MVNKRVMRGELGKLVNDPELRKRKYQRLVIYRAIALLVMAILLILHIFGIRPFVGLDGLFAIFVSMFTLKHFSDQMKFIELLDILDEKISSLQTTSLTIPAD